MASGEYNGLRLEQEYRKLSRLDAGGSLLPANLLARMLRFFMSDHLFVFFVEEESALHEVLTWGAQPCNNEILRWYGPDLASFDDSCRRLMCTFNSTLPESSLKARIRYTTRECKNLRSGSIGETLGDEAEGFVMIDFQGHPIRYDQLGGLIKQCWAAKPRM